MMILVLTPCLYCNVSDSWMLPSKWQRAAIGAAGIYVELVLASICTFLWWFSYPELLLNKLCLERDVHLLGEHGHLQRQSAVALRRLLYPRRLDGDSQPAAEGHHHPQPQAERVVPGDGAAGGPLPAAAEPGVLRPLLDRRHGLPLDRRPVDLLVPLPLLPVVSSGDRRQGDGGGVAVGAVHHAAVSGGQVLLRAREDRSSVISRSSASKRLLAGRDAGGDEGVTRVRPRAELQALRRGVPRDGHNDPRLDPLPLLQRLRLLDAAQQVAAGGHRRGGHLRRAGAGLGLHLPLVVLLSRAAAEQTRPERDVHLLGEHGHLQRQSVVALRRLLYSRRPDGDSQPTAEGHHDPRPQAERVVPGDGAAGGPLFAPAEPGVFRPLLDRRHGLPLDRRPVDLLVPLPLLSVEPSGDFWQGDGGGVAVGPVLHAALPGDQVLLRAREDRSSEKAALLQQPGRLGGARLGVFLSAAAL